MKNFKSLIVLITLAFITGTTLNAQDCFDMIISTEYSSFSAVVTITIINHSGDRVTISDYAAGKTGTCPAEQQSHTITWTYFLGVPDFDNIFTTIECNSSGSCRQYDGCTIVIDPRLI